MWSFRYTSPKLLRSLKVSIYKNIWEQPLEDVLISEIGMYMWIVLIRTYIQKYLIDIFQVYSGTQMVSGLSEIQGNGFWKIP